MKIFILIGALLCILIAIDAIRVYMLVSKSKQLLEGAQAFQRIDNAAQMKILVLGDSTAVGTGVKDPRNSTAGRMSAKYPDAEIINWAQNGMRVKDVVSELKMLNPEDHFSLVLIQIGANDIIRLTSMEEVERDMRTILEAVSQQSDHIVFLHSGNVGEAPLFPIYTRPLFSRRSLQMRERYQRLGEEYKASYVDLISSPTSERINEDPKRYYAEDFLHLSDDGYGLWFSEIEKEL